MPNNTKCSQEPETYKRPLKKFSKEQWEAIEFIAENGMNPFCSRVLTKNNKADPANIFECSKCPLATKDWCLTEFKGFSAATKELLDDERDMTITSEGMVKKEAQRLLDLRNEIKNINLIKKL